MKTYLEKELIKGELKKKFLSSDNINDLNKTGDAGTFA